MDVNIFLNNLMPWRLERWDAAKMAPFAPSAAWRVCLLPAKKQNINDVSFHWKFIFHWRALLRCGAEQESSEKQTFCGPCFKQPIPSTYRLQTLLVYVPSCEKSHQPCQGIVWLFFCPPVPKSFFVIKRYQFLSKESLCFRCFVLLYTFNRYNNSNICLAWFWWSKVNACEKK